MNQHHLALAGNIPIQLLGLGIVVRVHVWACVCVGGGVRSLRGLFTTGV